MNITQIGKIGKADIISDTDGVVGGVSVFRYMAGESRITTDEISSVPAGVRLDYGWTQIPLLVTYSLLDGDDKEFKITGSGRDYVIFKRTDIINGFSSNGDDIAYNSELADEIIDAFERALKAMADMAR